MAASRARLPYLDELRCLALFHVFGGHAVGRSYAQLSLPWHGWLRDPFEPGAPAFLLPFRLGAISIALFFVISGFCVHNSRRASAGASTKSFVLRRLIRIYPPYLIALLVFALLVPWTRVDLATHAGRIDLLSHLFLLHNFGEQTFLGINPALWTVAVETQIYLLYPLGIALVGRLGWTRTLMLIGAVEVALRLAAGLWSTAHGAAAPHWWSDAPFAYGLSWWLGARLAEDHAEGCATAERPVVFWMWLIAAVAAYFVRPAAAFVFLFGALAARSGIAWLLSQTHAQKSAEPRAWAPLLRHLRWVGAISYSAYLLHQPLLQAVPWALRRFFGPVEPSVVLAASFACWAPMLLLAWLFCRAVERPSQRWARRVATALR